MVEDAISIQPRDADELQALSKLLRRGSPTLVGSKGEHATLPAPLYNLLKDIVRNLENGRSLVLMPEKRQLTTQRAAELLGMSRPYLIRLLDAGEMQYHLWQASADCVARCPGVCEEARRQPEVRTGQDGTRCVRRRSL